MQILGFVSLSNWVSIDMFLNISETLSMTKKVEPTLIKSFQPKPTVSFRMHGNRLSGQQ